MGDEKLREALERLLYKFVDKDGPIPAAKPELGRCWQWTGYINAQGYGRTRINGRGWQAHRVFYLGLRGQIPDGLILHHECENRSCVNPEHLTPVTNKVNVLIGHGLSAENFRKTHCVRGHLYDKANTRYRPCRNGVQRTCRKCCREDWHGRKDKRKCCSNAHV